MPLCSTSVRGAAAYTRADLYSHVHNHEEASCSHVPSIQRTALENDCTTLQFARPELALQYEEALRAADLTSIDQVIRDMGSGEAPALEVGEFEVNRGTRLMILGFNRVQLVRWPTMAILCNSSSVSC